MKATTVPAQIALPRTQRMPHTLTSLAIFASCIALLCVVLSAMPAFTAYADEPSGGDADFYAVLHEDGSLEFQAEASTVSSDVNYAGSLKGYATGKKVPWTAAADRVASISFSESFKDIHPTSLAFWFCDMSHATRIDVTNLDSSEATTLRSLFSGCSSLTQIVGLETLDTSSCDYFGSMFYNCSSLKELDLRTIDATHVQVMCYLFRNCSSLEKLDVTGPGWRTEELVGAVNAFEGCSSLKSLDLSSWDTSKTVTLYRAFAGCSSLEYLDLSGIDTSVMHGYSGIFIGCDNLKTVKLGEKFSFAGDGTNPPFSLPEGSWLSSADGVMYASSDIPNNVAATYTRAANDDEQQPDEGADSGEDAADETPPPNKPASKSVRKGGATYQLVTASGAVLQNAPASKKAFTLPASIKANGKTYAIVGIAKGAFKGTKVRTLTIKAKKLVKNRVKGCFKQAKNLTVVKVPKAKKKAYAKLLKKSISGKKVTIK